MLSTVLRGLTLLSFELKTEEIVAAGAGAAFINIAVNAIKKKV